MLGISVVTPSLNQGAYLPACLSSVARLSDSMPVQHLVIDGASTDGSVHELEAFARTSSSLEWWSEPDNGQSQALNRGFSRARHDLVMWINADDEVEPDGVVAAVRALESSPGLGAVFGSMAVIDESGVLRRRITPPPWTWTGYLWLGDFLTTPTVVFRRSLLARGLPVQEDLHYAMDYEFYLRLLRGVKVERRPEVMVRFRWHSQSKTGSAVDHQMAEALNVRQAYARSRCGKRAMALVDQGKRVALTALTRGRWPKPF